MLNTQWRQWWFVYFHQCVPINLVVFGHILACDQRGASFNVGMILNSLSNRRNRNWIRFFIKSNSWSIWTVLSIRLTVSMGQKSSYLWQNYSIVSYSNFFQHNFLWCFVSSFVWHDKKKTLNPIFTCTNFTENVRICRECDSMIKILSYKSRH